MQIFKFQNYNKHVLSIDVGLCVALFSVRFFGIGLLSDESRPSSSPAPHGARCEL